MWWSACVRARGAWVCVCVCLGSHECVCACGRERETQVSLWQQLPSSSAHCHHQRQTDPFFRFHLNFFFLSARRSQRRRQQWQQRRQRQQRRRWWRRRRSRTRPSKKNELDEEVEGKVVAISHQKKRFAEATLFAGMGSPSPPETQAGGSG